MVFVDCCRRIIQQKIKSIMKHLHKIILYGIFLSIISGCITKKDLQNRQEKATAVKNMVNSQNFVFMAQFANPMGWRTITLNYNYEVSVSKDSVISYLPYFGRAYVAPMDPTDPAETGIQFTSTDFSYQVANLKKGVWDVTIVPHNNRQTRNFTFNITESGYATLSVTSLNRQQISFNGYITKRTPKKSNSVSK